MSGKTEIAWTQSADGTAGKTWNPIRARLRNDELIQLSSGKTKIVPAGTFGYFCERVSPGCGNCYACTMNGRTLPAWGTGLDYTVPNREKVEIYLDPVELEKPLHWRKPCKIFPASMTDWCAEFVTNEMRNHIFEVIAATPQHTYQLLTKRAERMQEYLTSATVGGWLMYRQSPPWVHVGVSVEDQQRYRERVPHLQRTPAAVRWLSIEPLMEDLGQIDLVGIGWVVIGGESGHGARPFNIDWARSIIWQCKAAGVACFVKQIGSNPERPMWEMGVGRTADRKGCDPDEWPHDIRVREFPQ